LELHWKQFTMQDTT